VSKLLPVRFSSRGTPAVELEGVLHAPQGAGEWPAAIVCHPHPLGGGSMYNPVVTAIARALAEAGVIALRFNFRGAGHSGGQHDYGRGEQEDVGGAVDWLLNQPVVDPWRMSVAGYSFGAWVGLSYAQQDPRVTAVAAVGLTAWHYDDEFGRTHELPGLGVESWQFDPGFMRSFTRPKLFVGGERDAFAPPGLLRAFVERIPEPKTLHMLPGVDHFFQGREREVGDLVAGFAASL